MRWRVDDFRYVVPPEIEAIPEAKKAFLASMEEDAKRYLDLAHKLEEGHTARLMAEGMPEKQVGDVRIGIAELCRCSHHLFRLRGMCDQTNSHHKCVIPPQ